MEKFIVLLDLVVVLIEEWSDICKFYYGEMCIGYWYGFLSKILYEKMYS